MKTRRTRSRAIYLAALVSVAAAIGAACADSEASRLEPLPDGGLPDGTSPPDASFDAGADADARVTIEAGTCSPAGWCATNVDPQSSFDDLWPLESSAIAIASRGGRSSVIAYEESSWKVIHEAPFLLASVWASTDDVWVAGDDGYVAHGAREGNDWTWTTHSLALPKRVSVIWGAGPRDVYALADARIWRLVLDGDTGAPDAGTWSVEYGGASAPDPEITLTALVGRTADDIWVTGTRGMFLRCGLVVHKTTSGWVPVIEGRPNTPGPFEPPACVGPDGGTVFSAPVGKATATGSGELVAVTEADPKSPSSFARIRHAPDGAVEVTLAPRNWDPSSLWGLSGGDLYAASFSVVERGRNIWADGGTWAVSTVAFEGIAIAKPFHVVRGTRSDNIWLAGDSYVFHKTSP